MRGASGPTSPPQETCAAVVRGAVFVAAMVAVLFASAIAHARGYEVAPATGRLESRPTDAVRVDVVSSSGGPASSIVALPFGVRVYGVPTQRIAVTAHGWALPLRDGNARDVGAAADPTAPHGQDAATGAFPYTATAPAAPGGANADGVIAPLWTTFSGVGDGTPGAGAVWTWTAGAAPRRRFVVSWEGVVIGAFGRSTVQLHLHEHTHTIVFAYTFGAVTASGSGTAPPTTYVCGLDEPRGARFTAPLAPTAANAGIPPSDFVLTPRAVVVNVPEAPRSGAFPVWEVSRLESLRGDDGSKSCPYVAKGTFWFFAADRAVRGDAARRAALVAEDRTAFPGTARGARAPGDPSRWVRQVLDGKAVLLPEDGGPAVRFWFRVVEWFSIDDRGLAGRDDHVWNLRRLLTLAFPAGDPRADISRYVAWRAAADARLDVGKLFSARQTDDAGPQFDTGRATEYVQWCARLKTGRRGAMPDADCPPESAGWVRFPMVKPDETDEQHADRRDVRFVPDPNHVASGYSYVVGSPDWPAGWVHRRRPPIPGMTAEPFDFDPEDPRPGGRR